ncbi:unnamed protein product [Protopolystoma xenopodis]|uniref:Uncharacterized protein n=1 Tax=Protopolystoma xenopodis TaxID=117903 RepID=A0A448X2D6_9PLAT|nr:unnamed protein product [Protopolystoma xenopodis]
MASARQQHDPPDAGKYTPARTSKLAAGEDASSCRKPMRCLTEVDKNLAFRPDIPELGDEDECGRFELVKAGETIGPEGPGGSSLYSLMNGFLTEESLGGSAGTEAQGGGEPVNLVGLGSSSELEAAVETSLLGFGKSKSRVSSRGFLNAAGEFTPPRLGKHTLVDHSNWSPGASALLPGWLMTTDPRQARLGSAPWAWPWPWSFAGQGPGPDSSSGPVPVSGSRLASVRGSSTPTSQARPLYSSVERTTGSAMLGRSQRRSIQTETAGPTSAVVYEEMRSTSGLTKRLAVATGRRPETGRRHEGGVEAGQKSEEAMPDVAQTCTDRLMQEPGRADTVSLQEGKVKQRLLWPWPGQTRGASMQVGPHPEKMLIQLRLQSAPQSAFIWTKRKRIKASSCGHARV